MDRFPDPRLFLYRSRWFSLDELLYLPRWRLRHDPSEAELDNLTKLVVRLDFLRDCVGVPLRVTRTNERRKPPPWKFSPRWPKKPCQGNSGCQGITVIVHPVHYTGGSSHEVFTIFPSNNVPLIQSRATTVPSASRMASIGCLLKIARCFISSVSGSTPITSPENGRGTMHKV